MAGGLSGRTVLPYGPYVRVAIPDSEILEDWKLELVGHPAIWQSFFLFRWTLHTSHGRHNYPRRFGIPFTGSKPPFDPSFVGPGRRNS